MAKCKVCGQEFNHINGDCYKIPMGDSGKKFRYIHKECFEELEDKPESAIYLEPKEKKERKKKSEDKEEKEKNGRVKITDYIQKVFGGNENVKWNMVGKQITKALQNGMTLEGIYNALYYWYDVKKNSTAKANGSIGILDYCYDDAQKYFKELERLEKVNEKPITIEEEKVTIKYTPTKSKVKCYLGNEVDDLGF